MRSIVSLLAVSLLLAGCGGDATDTASDTTATTAEVGQNSPAPEAAAGTTVPDHTGAPVSPEPDPEPAPSPTRDDDEDDPMEPSAEQPGSQLTDDAVADLASRVGAPPTAIDVLQTEQVTWPDGSLGCPKPGEFYTQAQVEGYRIVLQHDGRVYLYHAGEDGPAFLCESDEKDGGYDFVPPPGIHG